MCVLIFLHQVNLYSDPPKPGHSVQSGSNHDTSKFMTLNFPQAQRAEITSASLHQDGHSTHQGTFILISIYHFAVKFIISYILEINESAFPLPSESHCSSDLLLYVQLNIVTFLSFLSTYTCKQISWLSSIIQLLLTLHHCVQLLHHITPLSSARVCRMNRKFICLSFHKEPRPSGGTAAGQNSLQSGRQVPPAGK